MIKYKIDDNDPKTYVISKLDGKKYLRITHKHTKRYGLSLDEYKEKFNCKMKDIISEVLYSNLAFTKKKAIETYGEIEGVKRWDEYRKKQADTNTFEYKNKKYGMTMEEFNAYNASRAVTIDNLTKRHGEGKGKEIWNNYRKKQAHVGCSLEYFIEKYGEIEGEKVYNEINKKKSLSLENYIIRYGEKEGRKRYLSHMEDRNFGYSNIAKNLFDFISKDFVGNKIYYCDMNNNKEFGLYDTEYKRYYYYDYIDYSLKRGIEFNGDVFHGNPKTYKSFDTPNPFNRSVTCEQLWKYDEIKIKKIEELHGIKMLTIWESDYNKNPESVIIECINFLKNG